MSALTTQVVASFGISPEEPTTAEPVQLFDCSRDPNEVGIAWRAWDFGDGGTGVGSSPVHRYAEPGEYSVTLTLATFDGRVASESRTFTVEAEAAR
jgi:PKD repeat protein